MSYSKHANERVQTRHIPNEIIDLALKEGVTMMENSDRILLTKEMIHELQAGCDYSLDLLLRAEKVVPIVVVLSQDHIITVFRPRRRINRQHA